MSLLGVPDQCGELDGVHDVRAQQASVADQWAAGEPRADAGDAPGLRLDLRCLMCRHGLPGPKSGGAGMVIAATWSETSEPRPSRGNSSVPSSSVEASPSTS